jgi:hypothetical protein
MAAFLGSDPIGILIGAKRPSGTLIHKIAVHPFLEGPALSEHAAGAAGGMRVEGFVIPVTVDDLAANGLLGEADPQVCWERSVETLTARKDDIAGLAVASDERIEAYLLYVKRGVDVTEILSLRSFVEDGGARLTQLLSHLRAPGLGTCHFPKVHPAEISKQCLETLGFRAAGRHRLYAATARSN